MLFYVEWVPSYYQGWDGEPVSKPDLGVFGSLEPEPLEKKPGVGAGAGAGARATLKKN